MTERYRNKATRELVKATRKSSGGSVDRVGVGRLRITGPNGTVTIQEPSGETRKDLQRSSVWKVIAEQTGLELR